MWKHGFSRVHRLSCLQVRRIFARESGHIGSATFPRPPQREEPAPHAPLRSITRMHLVCPPHEEVVEEVPQTHCLPRSTRTDVRRDTRWLPSLPAILHGATAREMVPNWISACRPHFGAWRFPVLWRTMTRRGYAWAVHLARRDRSISYRTFHGMVPGAFRRGSPQVGLASLGAHAVGPSVAGRSSIGPNMRHAMARFTTSRRAHCGEPSVGALPTCARSCTRAGHPNVADDGTLVPINIWDDRTGTGQFAFVIHPAGWSQDLRRCRPRSAAITATLSL